MPVPIRSAVRGFQNLEQHEDIRLLDSWVDFTDDGVCDFLVYHMQFKDEETGEWEEVYKAVRFLRLRGVPRELRELKTATDIFDDILSGLWQSDVDFLHVIARIHNPKETLLFLYGVQGVSQDLEEAKDIAREGYAALTGSLRGAFSQIRFEQLGLEDAELLRAKMYDMRFIQALRGIPKQRRSAAGSSQSSLMGHISQDEAEEQIEELIRGVEHEFVMVTIASPVPFESINTWLDNHNKEQSMWESEKTGMKSINVGLSTPMVLAGNTATGESSGSSISEGTSETVGASFTQTSGTSEGVGHTTGVTETIGESHTVGETRGETYGTTIGETETYTQTWGRSQSITTGETITLTEGISEQHSSTTTETHSTGTNQSWGETTGQTTTLTESSSETQTSGWNRGTSLGTTHSVSQGGSYTESTGTSDGTTLTRTESQSINQGFSAQVSSGGGGSLTQNSSRGYDFHNSAGTTTGGGVAALSVEIPLPQTSNQDSAGLNLSGTLGTTDTWNHSRSFGQQIGIADSLSNAESSSRTITNSVSSGTSWQESAGETRTMTEGESGSTSMAISKGSSLADSYSRSSSRGVSEGFSQGTSIGLSRGSSFSTARGMSSSTTTGTSYSEAVSRGTTRSESYSESVSRSETYGQTVSRGVSESTSTSRSRTESEAHAYSRNEGTSKNIAVTQGLTRNRGFSASMAVGPSIGFSKSVQWTRKDIETITQLMEHMRMRLMEMVRAGGWFVDVYFLTGNIEAKEQVATLSRAAFWAEGAMPSPVQVIEPNEEWTEHLLTHAFCFSPCTSRDPTPGIMEPYQFSTILLPSELAAYTHIPRGEFGGLMTVAERIPLFAVPETKGKLYMGRVISPETGEVTRIPYSFDEKSLMHTLIAGASGSGKTVSAIRYVHSILENLNIGAVCLDWKSDWRALARYLPPERFRFYGLDAGSIRPIEMNLLEPPEYILPTTWRDKVIESMCIAFGLGSKQYGILYKHLTELFYENDIIRFVTYEKDGTSRVIEKHYDTIGDGLQVVRIPDNGFPEVHPNWRERIRDVTLATLYQRLRQIREVGLDKNSRGLSDSYDSLLTRLEYYVSGDLRRLYASNRPNTVKISDFVHGSMVTVLEGGNLDSLNKMFIINVFMQGLFLYCKEKYRRNGNKVDNEILVVLEEAHNVIPGDERGMSDQPLPIAESVWEQAFNESRGYGMYMTAILQVPSHIPSNIVSNCSNFIVHRLGNQKDTELMTTVLVRDSMRDHRDVPRFLVRLPVGMAVVKQARVRNLWEMEPCAIMVDYLTTDTPSDEVLLELLSEADKAQSKLR